MSGTSTASAGSGVSSTGTFSATGSTAAGTGHTASTGAASSLGASSTIATTGATSSNGSSTSSAGGGTSGEATFTGATTSGTGTTTGTSTGTTGGCPDRCNGACTNLQTDSDNCGTCGHVCADLIQGGTCSAGVCGCPSGSVACEEPLPDLSWTSFGGTAPTFSIAVADAGGNPAAAVVKLQYQDTPAGENEEETYSFVTTATQTGLYRFDWAYSTSSNNDWYSIVSVIVDGGATTTLLEQQPFGFAASGQGEVALVAGQAFGFSVTMQSQFESSVSWGSTLTLASTVVCADLNSDANNCGLCGAVCPGTCAAGVCSCTSAAAGGCATMGPADACCEGACIDPKRTASDCGSCGTACAAGATCVEGRCSGGCGSSQDCPNDSLCLAGACYLATCEGPDFGSSCASTTYQPGVCLAIGACAEADCTASIDGAKCVTALQSQGVCQAGACVPTCTAADVAGGSACTTSTGEAGTCVFQAGNPVCATYSCTADDGDFDVPCVGSGINSVCCGTPGAACVDLTSDPNNCGACGAICNGICLGGMCEAPNGQSCLLYFQCASTYCNGTCQVSPGYACTSPGCAGDPCDAQTPCQAGACLDGFCSESFATCLDWRQFFPDAGSGFYPISPDHTHVVTVYCDMAFETPNDNSRFGPGGWTLIEVTSAVQPPDTLDAGTVAPLLYGGAPAYMPTEVMKQVANNSSQVSLRSPPVAAGLQPTQWIASVSGSPPVSNLSAGKIINQLTDNPSSPGDEEVFYVGPLADAGLNFTCATTSQQYPYIYWSCGNLSGLDLQAGVSTWQYRTSNTPFEVYVR